MPTTLSVNQVIGHTLAATANVDIEYPIGTKIGTVAKDGVIGVVYSYAFNGGTDLYWMVQRGANNYVFVKHDINKITLTDGKQILADIQKEKDKQEYEEKGALRYYADKFLPWIVGGVVVYFAAPSFFSLFEIKTRK